MTAQDRNERKPSPLRLWLEAGIVWLCLFALLAINVFLSFVPFGAESVPVHMTVSFAMVVLLVVFFMDFKAYSALLRLTTLAGVFWLVFMFVLTAADYFTRQ
jgi:cytochrome c oxidase subunit IV